MDVDSVIAKDAAESLSNNNTGPVRTSAVKTAAAPHGDEIAPAETTAARSLPRDTGSVRTLAVKTADAPHGDEIALVETTAAGSLPKDTGSVRTSAVEITAAPLGTEITAAPLGDEITPVQQHDAMDQEKKDAAADSLPKNTGSVRTSAVETAADSTTPPSAECTPGTPITSGLATWPKDIVELLECISADQLAAAIECINVDFGFIRKGDIDEKALAKGDEEPNAEHDCATPMEPAGDSDAVAQVGLTTRPLRINARDKKQIGQSDAAVVVPEERQAHAAGMAAATKKQAVPKKRTASKTDAVNLRPSKTCKLSAAAVVPEEHLDHAASMAAATKKQTVPKKQTASKADAVDLRQSKTRKLSAPGDDLMFTSQVFMLTSDPSLNRLLYKIAVLCLQRGKSEEEAIRKLKKMLR
ncbi:hypothetical protein H9P43_006258 [Blastocladiella emersonii ATCC 22665]|nr:hypothetical protein H9P43_006258 [Blastocladiella emersonii ATCC 22665]